MKLDVNDKVRIMSGKTSTVVGTIRKIKQGLFRKKYLVIVKFKTNNWLSGNAEVSYFWKTGEEIIEKLDKNHGELN